MEEIIKEIIRKNFYDVVKFEVILKGGQNFVIIFFYGSVRGDK